MSTINSIARSLATRTHVPSAAMASTAAAGAQTASTSAAHAVQFADGAAAVAQLGTSPLKPTGAVADALTAGRLLRTSGDETLDAMEQVLRTGAIDRTNAVPVGAGINGELHRVQITSADGARSVWAVEKPAAGQAAQEEFAWKLARAMGIDHYVPAVARRADGMARIQFREGTNLSVNRITDAATLEHALADSYLRDTTLKLTSQEAAQAARIDRQLLQTFDYLLANNDRHLGNALYDAKTGALSLIDHGHSGRGALSMNRGTQLEPSLRALQVAPGGGVNQLDPAVVQYLRQRLDDSTIRSLHDGVYEAADIARPPAGTIGASFEHAVRGREAVDGITARLRSVQSSGEYTSRAYRGDNGVLPGFGAPPIDPGDLMGRVQNVQGLRAARAAFEFGFA